MNNISEINNLEDLDVILNSVDNIEIMAPTEDYLLNEKIFLKNTLFKLIANQKDKIVKNNNDLNLAHLFEKHLFSSRRIKVVLNNYPQANRCFGEVPYIFLEKSKDKSRCVKELFRIMAEYSLILNYDYNVDICKELDPESCLASFSDELSKITLKDITVEYIGHGVNGNGFKLSIDNKRFFYKTFYPHNLFHDSNINYLHGGFIEPAFGLFANKNARKNQFAKFYMGKIATKYDRDAFMLTEFLESDYERPQERLAIDYVQMKESEMRRFDNILEGKIADFGGMIPNKDLELYNPKVRKIVRVILDNVIYKHIGEHYSFSWKISDKSLKNLMIFIKKCDDNLYKRALSVINNHHIISDKMLKYLDSIKETDKGYFEIKTLAVNDIFSKDIDTIRERISEFNVKIKTESQPTSEAFDGYIMLEMNENTICMIFYDINGKIKHIRIDKKTDGKFNTLIDVKNDEIDSFASDEPFYKLYSD